MGYHKITFNRRPFKDFSHANGLSVDDPDGGIMAFGNNLDFKQNDNYPPTQKNGFSFFETNYILRDFEEADFGLKMGFFCKKISLSLLNEMSTLGFCEYDIQYKRRNKIYSDYKFVLFYKGASTYIDFKKSKFYIRTLFEHKILEDDLQFIDIEDFRSVYKNFCISWRNNAILDFKEIVLKKDVQGIDILPLYLTDDSLYASDFFVIKYLDYNMSGIEFIREDRILI